MNNWEAIKDWIDNIKAFPKQTSFGRFHMGFYDSFEDVWYPLKDAYERARKEKARPLFFTGHSLGGAYGIYCGSGTSRRGYAFHLNIHFRPAPRDDERNSSSG